MCEHTTAFITPKGDPPPVCRAISIRKFKGSQTSSYTPPRCIRGRRSRNSQGRQPTRNFYFFYHRRGEKARCFQRQTVPLTALYLKVVSLQSGRIGYDYTLSVKCVIVESVKKRCSPLKQSSFAPLTADQSMQFLAVVQPHGLRLLL